MKVFHSPSQRELFSRDQGELPPVFRKIFETLPSAVVQPHTVEEAADAVRTAYQNGSPIVPRGAGSTAFGQVTPVFGGIVLDLSFLKAIRRLDSEAMTVTVECGVRWADLFAYLEERGFALGSYPSSWYSTVGGWIATGGIGMNTLGFGPLCEQVREIELCTHDGQRRNFPCGSQEFDACFETEGQMGIILTATIRIRPLCKTSYPMLIPCSSLDEAWKLYSDVVTADFALLHAGLYNPERMHHFNHTLEAKMERQGSEVRGPFSETWSVFFFLEDASDSERLRAWLNARRVRAAPQEQRLGQLSSQTFARAPDFQAAYVWEERFYPLKGKRYDQMFLGNEVRIDNSRGAAYIGDLSRLLENHKVHSAVEVNAATKNDSVVIASFMGDYGDPKKYFSRLSLIFGMDELACGKHGARIYHIGLYNSPFIHRKFGSGRLAAFRRAKMKFDPRRLYNPGKFFEFKTALTRRLPGALHTIGFKTLLPLLSSPPARVLFDWANRFLGAKTLELESVNSDRVLKTWRECVNCGFCIPVCPAYLATQDERTTARGKLFIAARWSQTGEMAAEDAILLQSCMHCGACTKVCQNTLDLVPVWREMEARIIEKMGKPVEAIEQFVYDVESSADYKRLLRHGFITDPLTPTFSPRGSGQGEG